MLFYSPFPLISLLFHYKYTLFFVHSHRLHAISFTSQHCLRSLRSPTSLLHHCRARRKIKRSITISFFNFFLPIMYHIVFSRYCYHYHLFIYKCSLINFNFILAGTHQTASHISSSAGVLKNIICHLFTIFIINITCSVY